MNRHFIITRLAIVVASVTLVGCEDPNKMFEGVWTTDTVFESELEGHLVGTPMLAIGHYGLEMTGLVYFRASDGQFTDSCPCALIKGDIAGAVDFDDGRVSFTSACLETAGSGDAGSVDFSQAQQVSWELTLGDEPDPDERTLTGTVSRAGQSESVVFKRSLREVPDAQRMCPPEGWCEPVGECGDDP